MCQISMININPEWLNAIATTFAAIVGGIGFIMLIKDGKQKQNQINALIDLNKQLEQQTNESKTQTFFLQRSVEIMDENLNLSRLTSATTEEYLKKKALLEIKKEKLKHLPFFESFGRNIMKEGRIELTLINVGQPAINLMVKSLIDSILVNFLIQSNRVGNKENIVIKISTSTNLKSNIKYSLLLTFLSLDNYNYVQKIEGSDLYFNLTTPEEYFGSPKVKG